MVTTVINLAAGPGSGKSTTAAGLFYFMKLEGMEVELVTEYAKDLTWLGDLKTLKNQLKVFKEQKRRLDVSNGKVKYIVTDSPLLLSHVYLPKGYNKLSHENIDDIFNSYHNLNFFINRTKKYNPNGRNQTEEAARLLDFKIESLLKDHEYYKVNGDKDAPEKILKIIKENEGRDL